MAKGDMYKCEECGLVVVVEDPCGCATVDLICCEVPMKKVKKAPEKKAKPAVEKK
ncbi:MAG: hypothetical protein N3D12_04435 [Candidatus Methanomethyliaceae archaeon]|nr:hypothetical protein [Candidatus Methanomethyliaceae archaeon]